MNTKHDPNYCPSNTKIGEGNFGFDVRPSKEAETEALRLHWSGEKKDDSDLNKKELNVVRLYWKRRRQRKGDEMNICVK